MASDEELKDTEGHKLSRDAWGRDAAARTDADDEQEDAEGHKFNRDANMRDANMRDAADDDDTEGHKLSRD